MDFRTMSGSLKILRKNLKDLIQISLPKLFYFGVEKHSQREQLCAKAALDSAFQPRTGKHGKSKMFH